MSSELYDLQRSVDALRASIAEDAHRRQIEAMRLEQRRDDERREVIGLLERLRNGTEAQGRGLEDLPSKMLAYVKSAIYELRRAEFEAKQAGVVTGAQPLLLPPAHFEPKDYTQQVITQHKSDDIVVPGVVVRAAGWVARRGWPILLAAGGGVLAHWLAALGRAAG